MPNFLFGVLNKMVFLKEYTIYIHMLILNSLVVDEAGKMIVSDGLNYKLKVVSRHKEYLGLWGSSR